MKRADGSVVNLKKNRTLYSHHYEIQMYGDIQCQKIEPKDRTKR